MITPAATPCEPGLPRAVQFAFCNSQLSFFNSLPGRSSWLTLTLLPRCFTGVPIMTRLRLLLPFMLLTTTVARADAPPRADLVVLNAKIWTVNAKQPEAEAVAIWRDRILAVGSNADIRALAGPKTKVLDLKGRRVVPGFYDSH